MWYVLLLVLMICTIVLCVVALRTPTSEPVRIVYKETHILLRPASAEWAKRRQRVDEELSSAELKHEIELLTGGQIT